MGVGNSIDHCLEFEYLKDVFILANTRLAEEKGVF